jgi:hypothetical protein
LLFEFAKEGIGVFEGFDVWEEGIHLGDTGQGWGRMI